MAQQNNSGCSCPLWCSAPDSNLSGVVASSKDIFHDDFFTCHDKEHEEIDEAFKAYATLSVAQGQIRLGPGPKEKIKAFVQWTRDKFLMGLDPANSPFPVADTWVLMRH